LPWIASQREIGPPPAHTMDGNVPAAAVGDG
jgi:hypothetical protein